jgi:hypothetical protein
VALFEVLVRTFAAPASFKPAFVTTATIRVRPLSPFAFIVATASSHADNVIKERKSLRVSNVDKVSAMANCYAKYKRGRLKWMSHL